MLAVDSVLLIENGRCYLRLVVTLTDLTPKGGTGGRHARRISFVSSPAVSTTPKTHTYTSPLRNYGLDESTANAHPYIHTHS